MYAIVARVPSGLIAGDDSEGVDSADVLSDDSEDEVEDKAVVDEEVAPSDVSVDAPPPVEQAATVNTLATSAAIPR
ncbi:hypothetical protein [Calidifontibacter indicus]|uniref:hypothetical protein n=1 Tax=Calidifontibacter indicus TaxID=419650 RepID=UPI003D73FA69